MTQKHVVEEFGSNECVCFRLRRAHCRKSSLRSLWGTLGRIRMRRSRRSSVIRSYTLSSKGIQEYAESRDLHGHWIREMHSKQWAEAFEYQLFIDGIPFGPGTLGADLFTVSQPIKMLWSGVDPATRDAWKKSLKAGELAKETKAGQSLEKAGKALHGLGTCAVLGVCICHMRVVLLLLKDEIFGWLKMLPGW